MIIFLLTCMLFTLIFILNRIKDLLHFTKCVDAKMLQVLISKEKKP